MVESGRCRINVCVPSIRGVLGGEEDVGEGVILCRRLRRRRGRRGYLSCRA
jgi:hypothetical protein